MPLAVLLVLVLLFGTISVHYLAMRRVTLRHAGKGTFGGFFVALLAMVGLHLTYVTAYALAYALGLEAGIGEFEPLAPVSATDLFIHSVVNFTTLGLGTIVPSGDLRLISAVEASNGFIVTSMSASVFFNAAQKGMR